MPRHALAAAEKARAEHVVRAPARDRFEHPLEVGRVVLAIAVDVERRGVPLVARDLQASAKGGAESLRLSRRYTRAPCSRPIAAVASREPSSTSSTSTRQPACALRDAGEHAADRWLLVARDDDGETAPPCRRARPHARVPHRHQRAPARGLRLRDAEQPGDRRGQLEHRARLVRDGPRHAPLPHTTKGTGRSPQSRCPWPPIPRPWPWSAMRITVAPSSLPLSSRKSRNSPTWRSRLGDLVEVLGAAHAAHVAELIGGEQLEHQQIRVLLLDHPPALGHERARRSARSAARRSPSAPPPRRRDRAGARSPRAGRACPSRSSTSNTDSRAHAQPRSEVRAHAVLGRASRR